MTWWALHGHQVILALVFTFIGLAVFAAFFAILPKLLPFSFRKEIEEDQNIALAIVVGSIVIGIAIIIAATVG
ncbi:MAG: DUF350 domain-containing protein [Acidobacteria bacterium]|nr:DUF350 domain-containing protein [Acidobacteriota bacterium]MCK6684127.1 DUF350 domain-containing protein [Thermoanaerobaculia bacterium]